ncbi:MAG: putative phage abortive infection protein [Pseudomonadota bacterium]
MSVIEKLLNNARAQAQEAEAERLLSLGTKAFYAIAGTAAVALILYVETFGGFLSTTKGDWGVFGDYMGGLLNPAVGLLTVYLVLINVRLQRQELKNSVEEMKNSNRALVEQNAAIEIQTFQNTFFNWLSSYRGIVMAASFNHPSNPTRELEGHAALTSIYQYSMTGTEIQKFLSSKLNYMPDHYQSLLNSSRIESGKIAELAEGVVLERWRNVRKQFELQIDGVLRSLIGLLHWIDHQPNQSISSQKKWEYMRILRSQLSPAELTFLFYQSWTLPGHFCKIIQNYKLLDELPIESDPVLKFMLERAYHLQSQ